MGEWGVKKKSDKSANVFNGLSLRHLAITSNGRNLGGSYMHLGPSINEVVNFSGFLTSHPHVGSFLVLSVGNLDQFLTPSNCQRRLWTAPEPKLPNVSSNSH